MYTILQETGTILRYQDELDEDGIRVWVHDLLQGNYKDALASQLQGDTFTPGPVEDPSLLQMLIVETDQMKSRKELEDILAYEGQDIVVFTYSSEQENEFQQAVVKNFQRVAGYFAEADLDSLRFVSYDINLNGPSGRIKLDVPAMYLSPAFKRDQQLKYFMGDPTLEAMASYIVKHADTKIDIKVNKNLDQTMQMKEAIKQQQE